MGMTHQLLQGGQRHPGPYHICSEGMSQPMRVGMTDSTPQSMMAEQRAKPGHTHGPAALLAFQGNEQTRRVGQRTFQTQIASEDLEDFRGQRHEAVFVSFAMNA